MKDILIVALIAYVIISHVGFAAAAAWVRKELAALHAKINGKADKPAATP